MAVRKEPTHAEIEAEIKLSFLTQKQKKFVIHYCKCSNQREAAIVAGYSRKTADVAGSKCMKIVAVREAIEALTKVMASQAQMSGAELIEMLSQYARFNIKSIFQPDSNTLMNVHDLSDDTAACIQSIEVNEIYGKVEKGGEKELIGYTRKIRMVDKLKAVEILARHLVPAVQQLSVDLKSADVPPEAYERLAQLTSLTESIKEAMSGDQR